MFRLTTFNETPPNQWKYLVPETGKWVPDPVKLGATTLTAYGDLVDAVRAHYRANLKPIPSDLESLIQDQCCRSIPGTFCVDDKGRRRTKKGGFVFDIASVVQASTTFVDWISRGVPKVPKTEVIERSKICALCQFNQVPSGCSSCNMAPLNDLINKVVGGDPLPTDAVLKSCTICGCNLIAKTRLPTDMLLNHMSDEQKNDLPGYCWLKL